MKKSIFIRLTRFLLQRQSLLSATNVVNASRLVNNRDGRFPATGRRRRTRTEDTEGTEVFFETGWRRDSASYLTAGLSCLSPRQKMDSLLLDSNLPPVHHVTNVADQGEKDGIAFGGVGHRFKKPRINLFWPQDQHPPNGVDRCENLPGAELGFC
jgi:hypothetical protein